MPTAFVTTKQNSDPVMLSVNDHGSMSSSSIFLNGNWIKTIEEDVRNFFLGTNSGLKGNNVVVVTQVGRFPPDMETSTVDFYVDGAADVSPGNPMNSTKNFENGAPNVPHFMTYYFI